MMGAESSTSQGIPSIRFGSRTDVGHVREHNEDSLLVKPPLFVVCDGMGGHEGGEVASELAIRTIENCAPRSIDVEGLGAAVEEANLAIIDGAANGLGREGMGTTCTAALLEDDRLAIAQVGDSRAYLMHDGVLQQLTRDHSVVADLVEAGEISPAEARTHQWRSYITRALGLDPYMRADLYELHVNSDDRLLICSDGLYSMIPDEHIAPIMRDVLDPQACADALVNAALAAGGTDNVTVIVADAMGTEHKKRIHLARKAKVTAVLIVTLMVAIIVGAIAGFGYWIDSSAYLGEQDGKVAIYKGVPGSFLGLEFGTLEETTDVPLDDLQPGVATRIRNDEVRCDSLDAAHELVNEYKQDIASRTPTPEPDQVTSDSAQAGTDPSKATPVNPVQQSNPAQNQEQHDPA